MDDLDGILQRDDTECSCQDRSELGPAIVIVVGFVFLLLLVASQTELEIEVARLFVSSPQSLVGALPLFPRGLDVKRRRGRKRKKKTIRIV